MHVAREIAFKSFSTLSAPFPAHMQAQQKSLEYTVDMREYVGVCGWVRTYLCDFVVCMWPKDRLQPWNYSVIFCT